MMMKEMRAQLSETLDELMSKDDKLIVCDADLACSSGLKPLFEKYPERSSNFGISEANMTAACVGFSQTGLKPIMHSFCPFVTRRVMDQLYVSIGFAQNNLFVYASDPGYWSQYNGATHTSFEDIAITRSIPNLTVFAPSDARCVDWILREYASHPRFIYARIPRTKNPVLYDEGTQFEYGKGKIYKQGKDIAIICCGPEINDAIEAAKRIEEQCDKTVSIIDLLFLKPLDTDLIKRVINTHKIVISVENHNRFGGIGEAIGALISETQLPQKPLFKIIAVNDRYSEVGSVDYLKSQLHIGKEAIYDACMELVSQL